ncbi:Serine hydrolase-like protein [Eumeta japonica]|uniref:Serine hydrolase-like protein n=1 Tax=Eumeta variegata TaxID=151549 RepID=A0A4C1VBQ6_EUMVA|nr:Serine hydrolase-like protein [Eumeta japonica]
MALLEKEWYIQAPWGRIAIIAWGDCWDPPVLLCHGAVDSAVCFRPLVSLLPRNFYYIAMELPGNGKSDPLPPGLMLSAYDLIYSVKKVVEHFRWLSFIYIGHSLGTLIGKLYTLCYPGIMSQIVDLDPIPAYATVPPELFSGWYHRNFTKYFDKYKKFIAPKETGPRYSYIQAFELLKRNRGLTDETADLALQRITEPVGDGMIRFTFDQRMKVVVKPPISPSHIKELYTSITTPTLTILAGDSVNVGAFDATPFVFNEDSYPRKNHRVRRVEGNHDVHLVHPERLANYVAEFLLFGLDGLKSREDSRHLESELIVSEESWLQQNQKSWMTTGERVLSVIAVGGAIAAFPPKMNISIRSITVRVATCLALPLSIRAIHRLVAPGTTLPTLITLMKTYLALTRRTIACLKEYKILHKDLNSISNVLDSTQELLYRQQSTLSNLMAKCSSALLGNFPWLREDVDWDALFTVTNETSGSPEDLVKIHHAFLVIQSSMLRHIAMAHMPQSTFEKNLYKNHNERVYWLHTHLLESLKVEFKECHERLARMYRLLKNFGGGGEESGAKQSGLKHHDGWVYSEIHNGVAKASVELKVAMQKCNALDVFLDSCSINKENFDLEVLNKDIEDVLDRIRLCLGTVQNSQLRLKKLQNKLKPIENIDNNETKIVTETKEEGKILRIGDTEPETKDEVFFFVKTEDEEERIESAGDVLTAPGKVERENTRVVLDELRRKLVKREDVMRERERQALIKTMPELKDKIPEFPRQINVESDRKGFINKIINKFPRKMKTYKISSPKKLLKRYKQKSRFKNKKVVFHKGVFKKHTDIAETVFEAKSGKDNISKIPITLSPVSKKLAITRWWKIGNESKKMSNDNKINFKSMDIIKDNEVKEKISVNKNIHDQMVQEDSKIPTFSKKDLELSLSSDSDSEYYDVQPLKDVRRSRVSRKKNHPIKKGSITLRDNAEKDESLKPVKYSFGTGMAMASVLQVNKKLNLPNMAAEEVFTGDGEVSNDSGNDERS